MFSSVISRFLKVERLFQLLWERDTLFVAPTSGAVTLAESHHSIELYFTAGGAVTLPVGLPQGTLVRVRRGFGTGAVAITRAAGVSVESSLGDVDSAVSDGGVAVFNVMESTSVSAKFSVDGSIE